MVWTGKVVGAMLGFLLSGPFGAVFGLILGHYFDIGSNPVRTGHARRTHEAQQIFFRSTFLVMGHMAKADGRVSEKEISMARTIMRDMALSAQLKRDAVKLFNTGKAPDFNVDSTLRTLQTHCGNQHQLMWMFLNIQFRAAAADGKIGPNKRQILEYLCTRLGFRSSEFFIFDEPHQHRTYGRGNRSRAGPRPPNPQDEVGRAYKILEVNPGADDKTVKRAYRKKMSQNHPDKLVAQGLPEEMIKIATEKTVEIKAAYNTIVSARGGKR